MSTTSTTSPTPPDPLAAEARGDREVLAWFGGRGWSVPRDVDTWPTDVLRRCIGSRDGDIIVNHIAVSETLEQLLGDQWELFLAFAPRRRDLVPASHAVADAVGMGRGTDDIADRYDLAFGSILRTLALLDAWPDAVESDLNRFWNLDLRDRWRFDEHGRRRLTLRQIHARITHLPADSALAVAMNRRSPVELLLMDLYEPLAGRAHPARPLTAAQIAERKAEAAAKAKALAAYEARRVARGDRLATGLDQARANAQRRMKGTDG